MFTTAASARTTGASRSEMVSVVSPATAATCVPCTGAATATTVATSWSRLRDGFGFPVNHKRPWRPPSLTS